MNGGKRKKAKKYSVEVEGKWKRWKLKSLKVIINTQQINHNKYCYALIYKTFIRLIFRCHIERKRNISF